MEKEKKNSSLRKLGRFFKSRSTDSEKGDNEVSPQRAGSTVDVRPGYKSSSKELSASEELPSPGDGRSENKKKTFGTWRHKRKSLPSPPSSPGMSGGSDRSFDTSDADQDSQPLSMIVASPQDVEHIIFNEKDLLSNVIESLDKSRASSSESPKKDSTRKPVLGKFGNLFNSNKKKPTKGTPESPTSPTNEKANASKSPVKERKKVHIVVTSNSKVHRLAGGNFHVGAVSDPLSQHASGESRLPVGQGEKEISNCITDIALYQQNKESDPSVKEVAAPECPAAVSETFSDTSEKSSQKLTPEVDKQSSTERNAQQMTQSPGRRSSTNGETTSSFKKLQVYQHEIRIHKDESPRFLTKKTTKLSGKVKDSKVKIQAQRGDSTEKINHTKAPQINAQEHGAGLGELRSDTTDVGNASPVVSPSESDIVVVSPQENHQGHGTNDSTSNAKILTFDIYLSKTAGTNSPTATRSTSNGEAMEKSPTNRKINRKRRSLRSQSSQNEDRQHDNTVLPENVFDECNLEGVTENLATDSNPKPVPVSPESNGTASACPEIKAEANHKHSPKGESDKDKQQHPASSPMRRKNQPAWFPSSPTARKAQSKDPLFRNLAAAPANASEFNQPVPVSTTKDTYVEKASVKEDSCHTAGERGLTAEGVLSYNRKTKQESLQGVQSQDSQNSAESPSPTQSSVSETAKPHTSLYDSSKSTVTSKLNIPPKPKNVELPIKSKVADQIDEAGIDIHIPKGNIASKVSLFESKKTSHRQIAFYTTKNISQPKKFVERAKLNIGKQLKATGKDNSSSKSHSEPKKTENVNCEIKAGKSQKESAGVKADCKQSSSRVALADQMQMEDCRNVLETVATSTTENIIPSVKDEKHENLLVESTKCYEPLNKNTSNDLTLNGNSENTLPDSSIDSTNNLAGDTTVLKNSVDSDLNSAYIDMGNKQNSMKEKPTSISSSKERKDSQALPTDIVDCTPFPSVCKTDQAGFKNNKDSKDVNVEKGTQAKGNYKANSPDTKTKPKKKTKSKDSTENEERKNLERIKPVYMNNNSDEGCEVPSNIGNHGNGGTWEHANQIVEMCSKKNQNGTNIVPEELKKELNSSVHQEKHCVTTFKSDTLYAVVQADHPETDTGKGTDLSQSSTLYCLENNNVIQVGDACFEAAPPEKGLLPQAFEVIPKISNSIPDSCCSQDTDICADRGKATDHSIIFQAADTGGVLGVGNEEGPQSINSESDVSITDANPGIVPCAQAENVEVSQSIDSDRGMKRRHRHSGVLLQTEDTDVDSCDQAEKGEGSQSIDWESDVRRAGTLQPDMCTDSDKSEDHRVILKTGDTDVVSCDQAGRVEKTLSIVSENEGGADQSYISKKVKDDTQSGNNGFAEQNFAVIPADMQQTAEMHKNNEYQNANILSKADFKTDEITNSDGTFANGANFVTQVSSVPQNNCHVDADTIIYTNGTIQHSETLEDNFANLQRSPNTSLNASLVGEEGILDSSSDMEQFAETIRKLDSPITVPQKRKKQRAPKSPGPFCGLPPIHEDYLEKILDNDTFSFGLGKKDRPKDLAPMALFKLQSKGTAERLKPKRASAEQSILLKSLRSQREPLSISQETFDKENTDVADLAIKRSRVESIYSSLKSPFAARSEENVFSPSVTTVSTMTTSFDTPRKDLLPPGKTCELKTTDSAKTAHTSVKEGRGALAQQSSDYTESDFIGQSLPTSVYSMESYWESRKSSVSDLSVLLPNDEKDLNQCTPDENGIITPFETTPTVESAAKDFSDIFYFNGKEQRPFSPSLSLEALPVKGEVKINPRPGKVVIITEPECAGAVFEIFTDMPDCTLLKLSSTIFIKTIRGCWILYEHPNFEGRSIALEEGDIEVTNPWGDDTQDENAPLPVVIGSLRYVVKDYRVCQIDLFTDPDGLGIMTSYFDDTEELQEYGRLQRTCSIKVHHGVWLIYEESGFQGLPFILEAGEYPDLSFWNTQEAYIGSMRPLKMGSRKVEIPYEPKVIIFEKPMFEGRQVQLDREMLTFDYVETTEQNGEESELPFTTVGSMKVLGGLWVGYEKPGFKGHQYLLEEGDYEEWKHWGGYNGLLQSLRPILSDFSTPNMVMYSDENFDEKATNISILGIISNMDETGFGVKIESINVLNGVWVAFECPDFTGEQYILEKGRYSKFSDWGAKNCKISSVQPILLETVENPRGSFKVELFSEPDFHGQVQILEGDKNNIEDSFKVMSCRVISGRWAAYDQADFSGNLWVLEEGHFSNLSAMGCPSDAAIRSLKIINYEFSDPDLVLYGKENCKGRRVELSHESADLQQMGYSPDLMSLEVLGGIWVLYEYIHYRGRQLLITPGKIEQWQHFSRWDKIGSLRPLQQKRLYVKLRNKSNGMLMSTSGTLDDVKLLRIQVMEETGAEDQIWVFYKGEFRCRIAEDCCLASAGSLITAGSKLGLSLEQTGTCMHWSISPDGRIYSRSKPNLVLDIKGGNQYDQQHVVLSIVTEGKLSQLWEISVL